jgi:cation transport regulator ChaB
MSLPITSFSEIFNSLRKLRSNIKVACGFSNQVTQVDTILDNDKTGMVSPIYNFMVQAATVPMKIETGNETLNEVLHIWQTKVLNRNTNIAIQSGLRALSTENFRERWRSSLLGLNVQWGEEDFGGNTGKWIVPKRMWFFNGGAIRTEEGKSLDVRKFYLKVSKKKDEDIELRSVLNKSIYIRRPFTALHKDEVVPYFTQRGTVFNALYKSSITQKQSDVIESLIPLILKLQAGSDDLMKQGIKPSKEDFDDLKKQLTDAYDNYRETGNVSDLIASLRHDVNLDYLIPDLTKIFSDGISKSVNRDLMSSLGMIELQGFGTRQEAMLNPKVMIEEVVDAVKDWSDLLHEVMLDMLQRNEATHPTLANADVQIIPGIIQAFLTDEMRAMIRSMYDRGDISRQSGVEETTGLDFETQVQRIIKEKERGLDKICKPPVIQNLEQYLDPIVDNTNLEDQGKKPGTPEADNFNKAILENYKSILEQKKKAKSDEIKATKEPEVETSPFENIDSLPKELKDALPVGARLIWTKEFNDAFKLSADKELACQSAWSKVDEKYEKTPDEEKWVKKASIESHKDYMSSATFKFFEEIYKSALINSKSTENAIETALAITEKVSNKNKNGILVKDKKITKAQLKKLDDSNVIDALLNLELREKKLDLLNKLLKSEE